MVVHLQAVGHGDQPAALHLHRLRLVVMIEVAGIIEAIFGDQVQRARRVGQRGREPAANGLPGRLAHGADRILDDRALLRLVHAVGVAGVVDAVAEEFPAALIGVAHHFGMMLAQRHRQRDRAGEAIFRHHIRHPPVGHAVAVVAVAIADHVRMRLRPALAVRVGGWVDLIIFEIGRNPHRDLLAAGPFDLGAVAPGRKIVKLRIGFLNVVHQRASSQSMIACTGSTSAYLS